MFDPKLKEALGRVQKPGRYTGGEPGSGGIPMSLIRNRAPVDFL